LKPIDPLPPELEQSQDLVAPAPASADSKLGPSIAVSATTSLFSPQTWPFSLDCLPRAAYLVGGNVRDALLGRHAEYLDLDFVLPEGAVATAKAIAQKYRAGYVLLDAERQIARVVFENATTDFALQVGESLEEDLYRRDFTVNAIAYNPHTDQLLDPLQGYKDLQQHLIRMIAPENLKEDPLRLLRAYRQAAQLGFTVEPQTQQTIQQLAGLLRFIAAERVQGELNYLLNTPNGTPFLTQAWRDRLFDYWLPHATEAGLAQVTQIDAAATLIEQTWSGLGFSLLGWVRDQRVTGTSRSWLRIAKLATLVSPDVLLAEQALWQLKYSRAEIQAVLAVIQALPQVQPDRLPELSPRDLYSLFREVGTAFPALAALALAAGNPLEAIAPLVKRFLDPADSIAHPAPLLTGRDLMTSLQLAPGPRVGELLEAIQLARAEAKVCSREEALAFARVYLQNLSL
jgi:tRNA nucleotidyltransferase (CCA-adding enzyme)